MRDRVAVGPSAHFQAQGAQLHKPHSRTQQVTRLCSVSDASTEPVSSSTRRDIDNTVPVTAAQGFAVATRRQGGKRSRSPAVHANVATAYRPLRKFAAFGYPLQKARRGYNAPLSAAETEAAIADVTRGVYAASTVGQMDAKLRTLQSFRNVASSVRPPGVLNKASI